jgi:hypothetical protein
MRRSDYYMGAESSRCADQRSSIRPSRQTMSAISHVATNMATITSARTARKLIRDAVALVLPHCRRVGDMQELPLHARPHRYVRSHPVLS